MNEGRCKVNELAYYIDRYFEEQEKRRASSKRRVRSGMAVLRRSGEKESKVHEPLVLAKT
jgi:hypothetical protein